MSNTRSHGRADGGRTGARGYRYQYLRTLEALLAQMNDRSWGGVQVEGRDDEQKVDYALVDTDGRYLLAVQVKSVNAGAEMSATAAFGHLAELIQNTDAHTYLLETNAVPGPGAREFAEALKAVPTWEALHAQLSTILQHAPTRLAQLARLSADPQHQARMLRAGVSFDQRDMTDLRASLREDIRVYRNHLRAGLGAQAAGFMSRYLTDVIFERASSHDGHLSRTEVQELLGTEGTVVAAALGSRDWGLVIGAMPPPPDVMRHELMTALQRALPHTGERVRRQVTLVGLSGIGKSSLASGYIADTADSYDVVCWIAAQDQPALKASFRQLLAALAPSTATSALDIDQLQAVVHREIMRLPGRWAMVFDNAGDLREIQPWLPPHGAGDIIVTTINAVGPHGRSNLIPVAEMTLAEAVQLLANRFGVACTGHESELLADMAEGLGRWPLALEIGFGFMNGCGMTLAEIPSYLQQLRPTSMADELAVPLGYPRTLAAAIHMSLRQVALSPGLRPSRERQTAWGLLAGSSYCAPQQIPTSLVVLASVGSRDEIHADGPLPTGQLLLPDSAVFAIPQAIRFLRQFSLITRDADLPSAEGADRSEATSTIALNHIVQEIVRNAADTLPAAAAILDQLAFQLERWLTRALDLGEFERAFILFAHAETLAGHLRSHGIQSDAVALFFGNLSLAYNMVGDSQAAETLLRRELSYLTAQEIPNTFLITEMRLALAQTLVSRRAVTESDQQQLVSLIADILLYAQGESTVSPTSAAHFCHHAKIVLDHVLDEFTGPQWDRLRMFCADLSSRLPAPEHLALTADVKVAAESLADGDLDRAETLCKRILSSGLALGPLVETSARRILILCHAHQQKWEQARAQLAHLQRVLGQAPFVYQDLLQLAEKLGLTCCLSILSNEHGDVADELALQVLAALLEWPAVRAAAAAAADPRHRDQLALFDSARDLATGKALQAERTLATVDFERWNDLDASEWRYLWRMLRAATLSYAYRAVA